MDGIFGVGLAEILIVALAIFVVGGPKNTAKWARQMGLFVRQMRQMWEQFVAELETEMGPEGKELMDTARDLSKGSRQIASMSPQKKMLGETMKMLEASVDIEENTKSVETSTVVDSPPTTTDDDQKYTAWSPPKN